MSAHAQQKTVEVESELNPAVGPVCDIFPPRTFEQLDRLPILPAVCIELRETGPVGIVSDDPEPLPRRYVLAVMQFLESSYRRSRLPPSIVAGA